MITSSRLGYLVQLAGFAVVAAAAFSAPAVRAADAAAELIARFNLHEAEQPVRELPGWMPPRRVVAFMPRSLAVGEDPVGQLRAAARGAEIVPVHDVAALPAALDGADVLLGFCNASTLAAGAGLRWIQNYYVGVEDCLGVPAFGQRRILLTNSKQLSGPQIAEHVMALVLGLGRGLGHHVRAQQRAEWDERRIPMRELGGRTMLVVGLGGIGTEVAERAHGLGMRVIATRSSGRDGPDYVEYVGLAPELNALAARADVVVNCTPLTPATTGLFDSRFFAAMKPGGYFVNIGRGASVVTADLVAALRSGQVGGAGLDVTEPEPLPADSPLWAMENVIITPHVAGTSDQAQGRIWTLVVENLRRYTAGERMLNVVDPVKGY